MSNDYDPYPERHETHIEFHGNGNSKISTYCTCKYGKRTKVCGHRALHKAMHWALQCNPEFYPPTYIPDKAIAKANPISLQLRKAGVTIPNRPLSYAEKRRQDSNIDPIFTRKENEPLNKWPLFSRHSAHQNRDRTPRQPKRKRKRKKWYVTRFLSEKNCILCR